MEKRTAMIYKNVTTGEVAATLHDAVIPHQADDWLTFGFAVLVQRAEQMGTNTHRRWVYGAYICESTLSGKIGQGAIVRLYQPHRVDLISPIKINRRLPVERFASNPAVPNHRWDAARYLLYNTRWEKP